VRRAHRRSTCAWRTAPSIRTDLICDRDRTCIGCFCEGGLTRRRRLSPMLGVSHIFPAP
jgi:hypothetical protein